MIRQGLCGRAIHLIGLYSARGTALASCSLPALLATAAKFIAMPNPQR